MCFYSHVSNICASCFGVLRQIRSVRCSLTRSATISLVVSLVLSKLDYCASTFSGLPDYKIAQLQAVINASARLVFNLPRRAHISSALRSLQWLPLRSRVDLRLVTLVHKCLNGCAPLYLRRLLTRASDLPERRRLRSASAGTLILPKQRLKTTAKKPFTSSASQAYNKLPSYLTDESSMRSFKVAVSNFYLSSCD